MNNDKHTGDIELTNEEVNELELTDIEEASNGKIKKLQKKIDRLEEEKKQIMDDAQRARADFLNARKRLDEERAKDKLRYQKQHIEELLPLCDSFQMAMDDKETWSKADESWRKGIEGIHSQLMRLLDSYKVTVIDPRGEPFDPYRDEAIGTEEVADEKMIDRVVSVVQRGYEMKVGDNTEVIRHARVTTGIMKD